MEYIAVGIILFLFLAIVIASIAYNLSLHRKLVAQYETLGQDHDLEITLPPASFAGFMKRPPMLHGHYQSRELSIFSYGYGMDNTRQTDTAIRMHVGTPGALKLSLTRSDSSGKFGQVGRLKPLKAGHSVFDNVFSVRSNNPGAVKALFKNNFCELILNKWPEGSGLLSIKDSTLMYIEPGLIHEDAKRERIEALIALSYEIAEHFDAFK